MKRWIALLLTLLLCLTYPVSAIASTPSAQEEYVCIRVPYPEGSALGWAESRYLSLRYADTKEPVPLSSDFIQGSLYATVPAAHKDRPLEVFQGEEFPWTDTAYHNVPMGANILHIRGVLLGGTKGQLHPDRPLTRAEAVVLLSRMLSLSAAEETGYDDVPPDAWFAKEVSAAKAAGLLEESQLFRPYEILTRAELTQLVYQAFSLVGWIGPTDAAITPTDAASIPDAALPAYKALESRRIHPLYTTYDTGEFDPVDGFPVSKFKAEPLKEATRADIIELLDRCLSRLPVYSYASAEEWGFDEALPVVDGSTSTYPYTRALYGSLFYNYENHPAFPSQHSKSHASYERLISGEADALFAATKASKELEAQAAAAGVTLQYIPIAYDAMVFFTNKENPIESLTQQQIQDIYLHNAYENWAQVGGPNAKLLPYCRNTDSGSHSLMERYFLDGGQLHPGIITVHLSTAMSTALTDVAQALVLDPPAYAVGYSVYYYYQMASMLMGDVTGNELKLLKVDGVAPSEETIADGSYPLADHNYLVIRSDAPANAPARKLAEFMVSPQGQNVVVNAGFGALQ